MSDEKKLKSARTVYKTMCDMLDEKDYKYEKHDDELFVRFIVTGDDLPMEFICAIDANRQLVRLLSLLPVKFGEDKRLEGAIAASRANYMIVDGSFDYDYRKGSMLFRLTSSFRDSLLSKDLFEYMIGVSTYTVDEYNDKFLMIAKGLMPVETLFD